MPHSIHDQINQGCDCQEYWIKHIPERTGLTRAASCGSSVLPCLGPHLAQHHPCSTTLQKGAQLEKQQGAAAGRAQKQHGASLACLGITHHFWFLLALSALQAMKLSHISGSCPKRWRDAAAERAAWRSNTALGALS